MKKLILILALLLLASPVFAWTGTVVKVSDGDTIWVETEKQATKIRLYGIDAPESKQPYGAEATAFLTDFALGKTVTVVELDTDRYSRSVAIVILDGISLQEIMLDNGYAWVYNSYCKQCGAWKALEQDAKSNKRGMWVDDCVEPWVWRKSGK